MRKQSARQSKKSGIPREELFITTKLWIQDAGQENTKKAFQTFPDKLGLSYLDLYSILDSSANDQLLRLLAGKGIVIAKKLMVFCFRYKLDNITVLATATCFQTAKNFYLWTFWRRKTLPLVR